MTRISHQPTPPGDHENAALRVLVVDDDVEHLRAVRRLLERDGLVTDGAENMRDALALLRRHQHPVVVTDLIMAGGSGLDLLRSIDKAAHETDVVLMTAFGTVERAVEAMKAGARDFVVKPIDRANLLQAVHRCLDRRKLERENRALRAELEALRRLPPLLGDDPGFQRALGQLRRVARGDTTVLLRGESGTGKELFAHELHRASGRCSAPFVAIDCGALPGSLIESELFGHEEGAFTGAAKRRIGRIEAAHGGTLFLDEIGELPLEAQVKLLRVLQEREVVRIGGTQPVSVDVRLVAATHRDLAAMVASGQFRQDLYYRLNVFDLRIPALRERSGGRAALITCAFTFALPS